MGWAMENTAKHSEYCNIIQLKSQSGPNLVQINGERERIYVYANIKVLPCLIHHKKIKYRLSSSNILMITFFSLNHLSPGDMKHKGTSFSASFFLETVIKNTIFLNGAFTETCTLVAWKINKHIFILNIAHKTQKTTKTQASTWFFF